jgi:cell shape-determining protein MreC
MSCTHVEEIRILREEIKELQTDLKTKNKELRRLSLYECEHERLKDDLNSILHPNGDGPKQPSMNWLVSFVGKLKGE